MMQEIRKAMDDLLFRYEGAPETPATFHDLADTIHLVIQIARALEADANGE